MLKVFLLFILPVEPLSTIFRSLQSIKGINWMGFSSLICWWFTIFTKNICLLIKYQADWSWRLMCLFAYQNQDLCLGINISYSYTDLLNVNYIRIIKILNPSVDFQRILNLSLPGIINCVKINLLPILLYLLHSRVFRSLAKVLLYIVVYMREQKAKNMSSL